MAPLIHPAGHQMTSTDKKSLSLSLSLSHLCHSLYRSGGPECRIDSATEERMCDGKDGRVTRVYGREEAEVDLCVSTIKLPYSWTARSIDSRRVTTVNRGRRCSNQRNSHNYRTLATVLTKTIAPRAAIAVATTERNALNE